MCMEKQCLTQFKFGTNINEWSTLIDKFLFKYYSSIILFDELCSKLSEHMYTPDAQSLTYNKRDIYMLYLHNLWLQTLVFWWWRQSPVYGHPWLELLHLKHTNSHIVIHSMRLYLPSSLDIENQCTLKLCNPGAIGLLINMPEGLREDPYHWIELPFLN